MHREQLPLLDASLSGPRENDPERLMALLWSQRIPFTPTPFTTNKLNVAAGAGVIRPSLKVRRKSRLQLQIGDFQDNCAGVFHFVDGASDVTGRKINTAAAVEDDVCS